VSQYGKGWLYQAWIIATLPLFFFLTSKGGGYIVLALIFVMLPGWVMFALLRCRECGTSIFRVGPDFFPFYTTWPHRHCRRCGADQSVR
jgi:hypothetical protein